MSAPSTDSLALAGFTFFIPDGSSVDGQTTSESVYPDNNPTTNWTAYTLGDVLKHKWGKKKVSDPYLAPLANGDFIEMQRENVISEWVDVMYRQTHEIFQRLQYGLAAAINVGTAQGIGEKSDAFVNGWLLEQQVVSGGPNAGASRVILRMRAQVRQVDDVEYEGPKVSGTSLRFYKIPVKESGINTLSSGNSIVFAG